MLFTHRGIKWPFNITNIILLEIGKRNKNKFISQSKYFDLLTRKKRNNPKQEISSIISELLPKRLANNDL